jgi:hypothetical protein
VIALLPKGVTHRPDERTEKFWAWAVRGIDDSGRSVVSAEELISHWPTTTGKLTKSDAVAVGQLLERRGLGIEPDVRFGDGVPTPTSSVVVFRRAEEPVNAPGPHYGTALEIINLSMIVAVADGIRNLERLFRELGLDPNEVYSTLHATALAPEPDGLVSIRLPGPAPTGRRIPEQPEKTATLVLDHARLARTREESAQVAAELAEIFTEDSEPVAPTPTADVASVAGLDSAHTALLLQISERNSLSRGEFDDLADALGLLAGGALEVLNEAALDATAELLIEGDDPLEINHDIAKDMLQ